MAGDAATNDDTSQAQGYGERVQKMFCCGPDNKLEDIKDHHVLVNVDRVITDKPALLLISVFTTFMFVIWGYALSAGHYNYLINGMDWRGKLCGEGALAEYTHQAWSNPLMSSINVGAICVKSCPAPTGNAELDTSQITCICNSAQFPDQFGSGTSRSAELISKCGETDAVTLGYFTTNVNTGDPLLSQVQTGTTGDTTTPCAYTYRTQWAMRKCVPWVSTESLKGIVEQQGASKITTDYVSGVLGKSAQIFSAIVSDIAESVHILWASALFAVVLTLIFIILLRYCVDFLVKGILGGLLVMFIAAAVCCWYEYAYYRDRSNTTPALVTQESDEASSHLFLSGFVLSIIFGVLHTCLVVCLYDKIAVAISIIKVASKSFSDCPQLFIYPLIHTLAFVVLIVCWLIGAVLLYSAGTIVHNSNGVASMEYSDDLRRAAVFYFFGLVWFCAFINAVGFMIVACTVILVAFAPPTRLTVPSYVPHKAITKGVGKAGSEETRPLTHDDEDDPFDERHIPPSPMTTAAFLIVRYHLGTAALGSLVLTVIWFFRAIIHYGAKLAHAEDANCFLRFVTCCFQCMACCLENCVRYMNKMGYVITVIYGERFCDATFIGLPCVLRNIGRIGTTTYISSFVLVVIKITVTIAVMAVADLFIQSGSFGAGEKDITYSWVPYAVVGLGTYAIATAFMMVIDVGIDAILVAYCEAKEDPLKHAFKEEHIPLELQKHFQKHADVDYKMAEDDQNLMARATNQGGWGSHSDQKQGTDANIQGGAMTGAHTK